MERKDPYFYFSSSDISGSLATGKTETSKEKNKVLKKVMYKILFSQEQQFIL